MDMNDFANKIPFHTSYFNENRPARETVQVACCQNVNVEISMIAVYSI
jgi:enamine deaminase RidA (YjgF/YER057c/UK114 family)